MFEKKNTSEIYWRVVGKFLDHTNMPNLHLSSPDGNIIPKKTKNNWDFFFNLKIIEMILDFF